MLSKLFGSKLRAKVLVRLFEHSDKRFFVRELADLLNEDATSLSRELTRLTEMGIFTYHSFGWRKFYQANRQCVAFDELVGLTKKLAGKSFSSELKQTGSKESKLKGANMSYRFQKKFNKRKVEDFCQRLIEGRRGKMLGDEIMDQLESGELNHQTFQRLCRWVDPRRKEPFAQPIAISISLELFGQTFPRED